MKAARVLSLCALICMPVLPPLEAETVRVDVVQRYQTMRGFGTCIAPWVSSMVTLYRDPEFQRIYVEDMGMTLLRIELMPEVHPQTANANSISYANFNLDSGGAQPHANNSRARIFLDFAKAMKAINPECQVIGTAWSTPSWVKSNNLPWEGGAPIPSRYDHVAQWMIEWVRLYRAEGLDMMAISFANEPRFAQFYNSQVIDPEPYADILARLGSRMEAQGLDDVLIFGPEHMTFDIPMNRQYANAILNHETAHLYFDAFASHGYTNGIDTDTNADSSVRLYREVIKPNGWENWITEGGTGATTYDSSLDVLANSLHFLLLNNGVVYTPWQITGGEASEHNLMILKQHTPKSRAVQHYSRFIRPGMQRVGAQTDGATDVLAFADAEGGLFTLVLLNRRTSGSAITLELPHLSGVESLKAWQTTSAGSAFVPLSDVPLVDGKATLTIPRRSLTTLHVTGALFENLPVLTPQSTHLEVPGYRHETYVDVQVEGGPYLWEVSSEVNWLRFGEPDSGFDSGRFRLLVSQNSLRTRSRSGTIWVNHIPITVVQAPFTGNPWWAPDFITPEAEIRDTSTAVPGQPGVGFIYDRFWPFAFSFNLNSWIYIHTEGASPQGFYAWHFGDGAWIWANAAWGMYHHFGSGEWFFF